MHAMCGTKRCYGGGSASLQTVLIKSRAIADLALRLLPASKALARGPLLFSDRPLNRSLPGLTRHNKHEQSKIRRRARAGRGRVGLGGGNQ
eukprot:2928497-Rhodomonas_salina.1